VASWRRGEEVVLERNPYFRPRPKLDRIVVAFIPNQTARFNALRTHDVDASELDPDDVAQASGLGGIRVDRLPENGLEALYLQTASEPTNDPRVRRAIAFALDLSELRKAWHGVFPSAASVFPPPLVSWRHAPPREYPHDLALARRELDDAGWRERDGTRFKDGKPLEFALAINSASTVAGRLAIVVQAQLAEIGANVTLKAYPSNTFTAFAGPVRTGRFSLTPTALIGGSDPEQSLALACSQAVNGGVNYARYCSPAFEKLFAAQLVATSDAERDRDFDAIETLVRADVPLVPLYDMIYVQGVSARVTRYERNMLRFPVRAELWNVRETPGAAD
jgi:peptide/nickel transport system substrate-binding protein